MKDLTVFENPEFGQVRVVVNESNEPLFCLNDVCNILSIANPRNLVDRLDEKGVHSIDTLTNGGSQKLNFINEPNLYRVIFQSRKDEAKNFQDWVFNDILPSIRKTGSYSIQHKLPQTYKEALLELIAKVEENEKLQIENTELKPKGEFYDAVAGSDTLIDMNQVSKTLNIKGLGRNKLFEFLRSQKILMNDNQPYQQYVDKGYFKLIEVRWTNPKTGDTNITLKTMVFQTGLDFIRKTVKKYYK